MKYRNLKYGEIDTIRQNPLVLLDLVEPKEKYVAEYPEYEVSPKFDVTFIGSDGADEYKKNLYYVYRADGIWLRKETNLKNDERHGVQRGFYENGNLWIEENYKDGKHDGLRTLYHKDGRLDKVAMYRDNTPLCDVTLKMRFMQQITSIFGGNDDVEANNNAQWARLKKRYPNLSW